jgi:hypothetical protein
MLDRLPRLGVILLCPALGALGLPTGAATVDLKPVADTGVMESVPGNNLGAEASLACGGTASGARARILLRFDPQTSIPPAAQLRSVTVSMVVQKENFASLDAVYELHPVVTAWREGTGVGKTGSAAKAGESTWASRSAPSVAWGAPGGQAGVDFDPAASSSLLIAGTGAVSFPSSPQLVTDVSRWLASPESNQGWMLLCATEGTPLTARRFASREASPASSPVLQVTYDLPPPELHVSARPGNTATPTITLEWNPVLPPYQVQRRDSIESPWVDVGAPIGDTTLAVPLGDAEGYFRVLALGTP